MQHPLGSSSPEKKSACLSPLLACRRTTDAASVTALSSFLMRRRACGGELFGWKCLPFTLVCLTVMRSLFPPWDLYVHSACTIHATVVHACIHTYIHSLVHIHYPGINNSTCVKGFVERWLPRLSRHAHSISFRATFAASSRLCYRFNIYCEIDLEIPLDHYLTSNVTYCCSSVCFRPSIILLWNPR